MGTGFHPSRNSKSRAYVYLLALPMPLIYALALTGCISDSPGILNIFLAEIQDPAQGGSSVRIGYFGMCLSQNSTRAILYSSTFTRSSATLASRLLVTENFAQDALDLERTLSPPFLATAGVLFILGLISLSFLRVSSKSDASSYTAPGTSKWASRRSSLTFALVWISTSIAFVVAYTTTLTLSALVFAPSSGSQSTFQPTRGITLEALQWLIFGFSVLFSLGFSRIMRLHSSAAPAAGGDYPDLIPVAWPDLRLAEDLGYLHLHLHRSTKSYERKNYFRQRDAAQRNQCNGCKLNFQLVVKQIHVPHLLCE